MENWATFQRLLKEANVEKPDVFETKTFFTSFFFKIQCGDDFEEAARQSIAEAKEVMANPNEKGPPLLTRSYVNWRDAQRAEQGLPPITDNNVPQKYAFPPAPAHLNWNQK